MTRERLALALEQLQAGDWEAFEGFAADFLAVEYPSLQTMASPAGDKGRDGQMYSPLESPKVMVQYSVTGDWQKKIEQTITRLEQNFKSIDRLIYATPRRIGPDADELVSSTRTTKGISLDIRDKSWFLDRRATYPQRAAAADELCARMVDPLLRKHGLSERVGPSLRKEEARLGLLHLTLQARDEASGKGLTKEAFEALTMSALHDSDSDNTISREEIYSRVSATLPAGHEQQVSAQVDSALARLSGKRGAVKHHRSIDEFCLSHEERQALNERVAAFVLSEGLLERTLLAEVHTHIKSKAADLEQIGFELRTSMEWVLLRQGEIFASAVSSGETSNTDEDGLVRILNDEPGSKSHRLTNAIVARAIMNVLANPDEEVKRHLRRLADGYTLMAFMRQTPDVQKVIVNLFSEGDFWLDTSVILPLIAETLVEDPGARHYTMIFKAAREAGIKLYVTDGVVEEVERHLNRAIIYSRTAASSWNGSTPFIYGAYAMSGRARSQFSSWIEEFMGQVRPEEDVRDYILDVHAIRRRNLTDECDNAPMDLFSAVQTEWSKVHEKRRNLRESDFGMFATQQLVAHDTENYVGVVMLRSKGQSSPMGYRQWFVTLDKAAFRMHRNLVDWLDTPPPSPVLSPDFLSQFLRLGPLRAAIEREVRVNLPILTDVSRYDYIPRHLIETADQLRVELSGKSERVIQRNIRDSLDGMRMEMGDEASAGASGMEKKIMGAIRATQNGDQ